MENKTSNFPDWVNKYRKPGTEIRRFGNRFYIYEAKGFYDKERKKSRKKVYKELERILKSKGINLSVDKVLNIAKTVTTLKIKLPVSGQTLTKTMLLTSKHKSINRLFDSDFWKGF